MKRPQSNHLNQPLLVISKEKEKEIQKDIQNQLYQVPEEEELSREYEEVQKAEELYEKWQKLKKEEEYQKDLIARKKLERLEQEQKRLAKRLEEIITTPQEDEQEEKYKLIALRRRVEQDYKDELDKLEEQHLRSKEHQLEKVVRKKIEMEKLIEAKKKKNEEFDKLQREIETIEEVKQKRDIHSKQMLEQALKRIGGRPDLLDDEDKVLLSEAILQERKEAERKKEEVLQEIIRKSEEEKERYRQEVEKKVQRIQEQKEQINEQGERVLREKAIQKEMAKKGVDYLTQIELGNGPPLEYIRQNIVVDEDVLNDYRLKYNFNQVIRQNRRVLQDNGQRIMEIQQDMQYLDPSEIPYRGELKSYLNTKSPESLFVARKIIDQIIENGMRRVLEKENRMFMLKQQRDEYASKNKNLKQTQNYLIDREFVDEMADKIFAGVMRKIQREAADEIRKINLIAQQKTLDIIFKSVKLERNTSNPIDRIEYIFFQQRGDNLKKLDTGIKFNFLTQQQIQWGKVRKGKKNYNTVELMKQMRERKDLAKGIKHEQKNEELLEEEEDLDVIILDPDKEQCVEQLGLEKFRDLEIQHWEKIQFQYLQFKPHSPQIKTHVTFITLSPYKDLILLGMSNGEVAIYSVEDSPAIITALVPSFNKQPIVDIQFGMDNVGHLLILDSSGEARFCYFGFNLKVNIPKDQLKGIESLPPDFQPMFYIQYFALNSQFLARRKQQQDQQISFCVFQPAITFSCLQSQIFLGSINGLLMKFNSNVDLLDGQNYKFPIHRILNTRIIINEEEELQQENLLNLQIQNDHEGQNPHVFREFFESHKATIIFICFLESPEIILTIDKDGYIFYWEYDTGLYDLRRRSFRPKIKYRLQMTQLQYQPDKAERKKVFPDKDTKNLLQDGQQKYYDYFHSIELVKIQEKPLKDGESELLVCLEELPKDGEIASFEIMRVNHSQEQVIEIYMQDFKGVLAEGYIAKAKSSLANKFIYLEVIKPHILHQDLIAVEFVGLNTQSFKLKKLKPVLYTAQCDYIDFDIVDNYYPFMVSYLFVHVPQGIQIISLATGNVLKLIENHIKEVRVTFQSKIYIPKGIQVIENEAIFFSYQGANGCWKLQIEDDNDENDSQSIYGYYKFEYEKLFLQ